MWAECTPGILLATSTLFIYSVPTLPSVPSPAKIGKQHPDRVVETSTLSSVPPPDITYTLALPTSDNGTLSALQLEAITYACQVPAPPTPSRLIRRPPAPQA